MNQLNSQDIVFDKRKYVFIFQYALKHISDNEKVIEFICSPSLTDYIVVLKNEKGEIIFDILIYNYEQYEKLLNKATAKYKNIPVLFRISEKNKETFNEVHSNNTYITEHIYVFEKNKEFQLPSKYCFRKILQKDTDELQKHLVNKYNNELYSILQECIVHPEYNYGELYGLYLENKLCGYICARKTYIQAYYVLHCHSFDEQNKSQIEELMISCFANEKNNSKLFLIVNDGQYENAVEDNKLKHCFSVNR